MPEFPYATTQVQQQYVQVFRDHGKNRNYPDLGSGAIG